MNEPNVSLFFELIRSAIWNKPADESLFRDIDSSVWEEILSYAESHKVTALLYDGVLTLPELMRPEKTTVYKLFFHADAIEQLNVRNTQVLKELSDVYEKMGISFVLLKGHGNALCYPNPKRRPPGDIDFFFSIGKMITGMLINGLNGRAAICIRKVFIISRLSTKRYI